MSDRVHSGAAPLHTQPGAADRWADLERLANEALRPFMSPSGAVYRREAFQKAANPSAVLELIAAARAGPEEGGLSKDPASPECAAVVAPPAPFPVGARTNSKRAGWEDYFAGKARDACPFPPARSDLQAGYREGWDAASAHHCQEVCGASAVGKAPEQPEHFDISTDPACPKRGDGFSLTELDRHDG